MTFSSIKYTILLLFLLNGMFAAAQNGGYEVRAIQHNSSSWNDKYLVDIEIKASSALTNFYIADANFVLSFDETVIANPVLSEELDLSGAIFTNDYAAFFNPHTLTGSIDSFLVYNLVMAGGDGYPLDEQEWVAVGRVAFDILDNTGEPMLVWKTSNDFPPTVVIERVGGVSGGLFPTMDGDYNNLPEFNFGAIDDYVDAFQGMNSVSFPLDNDLGPVDPNTTAVIINPINGTASFNGETLTYVPNPGFTGADTLTYKVCELTLPVNCDTAWVALDVLSLTCDTNTECVWPGDTDNSTVVDNFDVLNLGIAYSTTGPQRPNASLDWEAQAAAEWPEATPMTAVNYKHIDTDGNGLVEDADTMAISLNWGAFYNPVNYAPKTGDIPFFIDTTTVNPDTTIYLPLVLGDLDNPVGNAYGLAFSIQYDEELVNPASAVLILNDSWLGDEIDILMMQRNFELEGRLDVGLTRTDGITASGAGEIGVLQLTIKDDVLLDFKEVDLELSIENVRLQKNTEEEILTDPQSSTVTITDDILDIKVLETLGLNIFPNPISEQLQINTKASLDLLQISNVLGQVIYTEKNLVSKTIDSSSWPAGIYTLTVQKGKAIYTTKLIKK